MIDYDNDTRGEEDLIITDQFKRTSELLAHKTREVDRIEARMGQQTQEINALKAALTHVEYERDASALNERRALRENTELKRIVDARDGTIAAQQTTITQLAQATNTQQTTIIAQLARATATQQTAIAQLAQTTAAQQTSATQQATIIAQLAQTTAAQQATIGELHNDLHRLAVVLEAAPWAQEEVRAFKRARAEAAA